MNNLAASRNVDIDSIVSQAHPDTLACNSSHTLSSVQKSGNSSTILLSESAESKANVHSDIANNIVYGNAHFGADGTDTEAVHGVTSDFNISVAADGSVTLSAKNGSDEDVYLDIECLSFEDASVAFDIDGNAGQVYRIYEVAFDREPDSIGLAFWIGEMDRSTALTDIARGFISSSEFVQHYGASPSNGEFVTKLYLNILGRDPEQAGYDYWLGELDSGLQDPAQGLVDFSEPRENQVSVIGQSHNGIEYQPLTA